MVTTPLAVIGVLRESHCFRGAVCFGVSAGFANVVPVAKNGLGRDIWSLSPSRITRLLHVCTRPISVSYLAGCLELILIDILRCGDPLRALPSIHQNINTSLLLADISQQSLPEACVWDHRHRLLLRDHIHSCGCFSMPPD